MKTESFKSVVIFRAQMFSALTKATAVAWNPTPCVQIYAHPGSSMIPKVHTEWSQQRHLYFVSALMLALKKVFEYVMHQLSWQYYDFFFLQIFLPLFSTLGTRSSLYFPLLFLTRATLWWCNWVRVTGPVSFQDRVGKLNLGFLDPRLAFLFQPHFTHRKLKLQDGCLPRQVAHCKGRSLMEGFLDPSLRSIQQQYIFLFDCCYLQFKERKSRGRKGKDSLTRRINMGGDCKYCSLRVKILQSPNAPSRFPTLISTCEKGQHFHTHITGSWQ